MPCSFESLVQINLTCNRKSSSRLDFQVEQGLPFISEMEVCSLITFRYCTERKLTNKLSYSYRVFLDSDSVVTMGPVKNPKCRFVQKTNNVCNIDSGKHFHFLTYFFSNNYYLSIKQRCVSFYKYNDNTTQSLLQLSP